jgi:ABC-type transport system involved in multi-copper enzyme maturation permease subunit
MNALFWLDLRVRVRERRLWTIAAFFLAMPLLITLLAMMAELSNKTAVDPGNVGLLVAMCSIYIQAGLLVLLSPLAAAQRISQEREQRTYAALVNSPLGPGAIARGKLLGAWAFTLWLGVLTLPFTAVAALWGGLAAWVPLACFGLNLLAGLTLASLALGLSGLFGRSLSAYLATGAVLFLWGLALPLVGGLTLGLLESGADAAPGQVRAAYCAFLLHHPVAPQIWMTMRGNGVAATFTEWGPWVPLYGAGVWLLLLGLGLLLAVRGLRREVD